MARGLPLINTHDPGPAGPPHYYERYVQHGPLPAEFHRCQEAGRFVEAVLWRVRNGTDLGRAGSGVLTWAGPARWYSG